MNVYFYFTFYVVIYALLYVIISLSQNLYVKRNTVYCFRNSLLCKQYKLNRKCHNHFKYSYKNMQTNNKTLSALLFLSLSFIFYMHFTPFIFVILFAIPKCKTNIVQTNNNNQTSILF